MTNKEEVWERLKHVPRRGVTFYPSAINNVMIGFNKKALKEGDCVTVRVLKNR